MSEVPESVSDAEGNVVSTTYITTVSLGFTAALSSTKLMNKVSFIEIDSCCMIFVITRKWLVIQSTPVQVGDELISKDRVRL